MSDFLSNLSLNESALVTFLFHFNPDMASNVKQILVEYPLALNCDKCTASCMQVIVACLYVQALGQSLSFAPLVIVPVVFHSS